MPKKVLSTELGGIPIDEDSVKAVASALSVASKGLHTVTCFVDGLNTKVLPMLKKAAADDTLSQVELAQLGFAVLELYKECEPA